MTSNTPLPGSYSVADTLKSFFHPIDGVLGFRHLEKALITLIMPYYLGNYHFSYIYALKIIALWKKVLRPIKPQILAKPN